MIKYNGKKYETIYDLAMQYGIKPNVLAMRVQRGRSIREAISFKNKRHIKYKGVVYSSRKDLIERLGLDLTPGQLEYRIRKTGSISKALKYKLENAHPATYKGRKYKSLNSLCKSLGVRQGTIHNRVHKQGLSLDEAIARSLR